MAESPRLSAPTSTAKPEVNSYDELPYDSHPYAQTHPSRLATIATLFGLFPPAVERCRVLELGCAAGGNIVPLAEAFPFSQFVGLDFSARQIADGEKVVRLAGLNNVTLRHANILDIDDSWGPFDYIICHGVFSWVPDAVREKILTVFQRHLTPHGVAYVSYNTYPGWHMRGMIRDMMRFHAMRFETASQRVQQARALLAFLAESARNDTGPYGTLLRAEVEGIRDQADSYLYHEHLEEVNDPLYFHQFVELADRHKLRYLGEARLSTMMLANFSPEVRKALEVVSSNQIQAEQYLDFVRNRTFRETLLVRDDAVPNWAIQPDSLSRLHVTTPRRMADPAGDVRDNTQVQYQTHSGLTVATSSPPMKAAMRVILERWPATVPFTELEHAAAALLGKASDGGKSLALGLLQTYLSSDLVELHSVLIRPVQPGLRPVALAEARARLAIGEIAAATGRHDYFRTTEFDRQLIPLLDGTRDRPALLDELTRLTLAGELSVQREGKQLTEPDAIRAALAKALEQTLTALGTLCLLKG